MSVVRRTTAPMPTSGSRSAAGAGSRARPTRRASALAEFEAAGVERVMLQTFLPRDLDMVRLLGEIFLA